MSVHILGNGPSIKLFNAPDYKKDIKIGCNFTDISLSPDYTVMVDVRPLMKLKEGHIVPVPVILSDRGKEHLGKSNLNLDIKDVVPLKKVQQIHSKIAMNSGQHAVLYSIEHEHNDDKLIHLWGIDSFWSDDLKSSSDKIMRNPKEAARIKPNITMVWRRYWKYIFNHYEDFMFHIHIPFNVEMRLSLKTHHNTKVIVHNEEIF